MLGISGWHPISGPLIEHGREVRLANLPGTPIEGTGGSEGSDVQGSSESGSQGEGPGDHKVRVDPKGEPKVTGYHVPSTMGPVPGTSGFIPKKVEPMDPVLGTSGHILSKLCSS